MGDYYMPNMPLFSRAAQDIGGAQGSPATNASGDGEVQRAAGFSHVLCIPDSTVDTDKVLGVEGLGGGKQLWLDRCPLMTSFSPACVWIAV